MLWRFAQLCSRSVSNHNRHKDLYESLGPRFAPRTAPFLSVTLR
jgi:hypothetical protein